MITVSDDASVITVSCDPEIDPDQNQRVSPTVHRYAVTDANGNIPSNLHDREREGHVPGRGPNSTDVTLSGVDVTTEAQYPDSANFNAMGMATFSILLREDAPEVGSEITVFVTTDQSATKRCRKQHRPIMYGEIAAPEPMPMPMTSGRPRPSPAR